MQQRNGKAIGISLKRKYLHTLALVSGSTSHILDMVGAGRRRGWREGKGKEREACLTAPL